jgi:hypothetical protein
MKRIREAGGPQYSVLDEDFLKELDEKFVEFFRPEEGTSVAQFVVWANYFKYSTVGGNLDQLAGKIRYSLAGCLPEEHKMFRDYEWAGGEMVNVWSKDDIPREDGLPAWMGGPTPIYLRGLGPLDYLERLSFGRGGD